MIRATGAVLLALAALTACEGSAGTSFGELAYAGPEFEVWASDSLRACGGTFSYTERWLSTFRATVSPHGTSTFFSYYWLTPEDFQEAPCRPGNFGCASSSEVAVYSTLIPLEHEIVHLELAARPPPLLLEGAAEMFGSIAEPYSASVAPLAPLLEQDPIPGTGYQTAGQFSRFLTEQHGLQTYLDLYDRLGGQDDPEALDAALRELIGRGLAETISAFEDAGTCSPARWRDSTYECAVVPTTPWHDESSWRVEVELGCEDADAIGPREGKAWSLYALEVEHDGRHELTISSDDDSARVDLFPCGVDCFGTTPWSPAAASVAEGGNAQPYLTAGRHWVRVSRDADAQGYATVTLSP